MPIEAQLSVPAYGKTAEHLQRSLGLRDALSNAKVRDGLLFLDVRSVLLLEDLYGRTHEQEASDDVLWWTES